MLKITGKGIKKKQTTREQNQTTQKNSGSPSLGTVFSSVPVIPQRDGGKKSQTQKLLTRLWNSFQRGKKK